MFKLLVTGTRNPTTGLMGDRVRYALGSIAYQLCPEGGELLYGEASGVDTTAKEFWESLGPEYSTRGFPYKSELGRAGGPIRNQEMVDAGPDLCVAFPVPGSKGTYDCARRAEAAKIPTFIITGKNVALLEQYLLDNRKIVW
jgi:hypothetical protein